MERLVDMKIPRSIRLILAVLFFVLSLAIFAQEIKDKNTLYQVSILEGLMRGDYDGKVQLREIGRHGDFGLGTFDRLDGEGIELEGIFYGARSDGTVTRMKESDTSPFAMATFFKADTRFPVTQSRDYNSLGNFINGHLATRNVPYAIKIKGRFGYIKIRSVPVQNKPYPVLAEVIKRQSIFEFRDIEGTLVGFRMPDYAQGINIAGYHLHFLSQDRSKGGHLLECAIDNAVVEVDLLNRIVVNLPESRNFYSLDFSSGASESSTAENGR